MKHIFLLLILVSEIFAFFGTLETFKADFSQSITDDKNKTLNYNGTIIASKPQNVVWNYIEPIKKDIYISKYNVVIVEPEIEQVIIRKIEFNLDFFKMIESAKLIKKNVYLAVYKDSEFTIVTENSTIKSISYIDEFENKVKILFSNQKQNEKIDLEVFSPKYPLEFDVIRD